MKVGTRIKRVLKGLDDYYLESVEVRNIVKKIEIQIGKIDGQGGVSLKRGIDGLVAAYVLTDFPILPDVLVSMVNELPYYIEYFNLRIDFRNLCDVIREVNCSYFNGVEWKPITEVYFPIGMRTEYLSTPMTLDFCIPTQNGYQVVSGSIGEHVIDYITRKWDGINMLTFTFRVFDNDDCLCIGLSGTKWEKMSYAMALNGEFVKDRYILHANYRYLSSYPSMVSFDNRTYSVSVNEALTYSSFLNESVCSDSDGYIISINGTEYKLKDDRTVDLEFVESDYVFKTLDGRRFGLFSESPLKLYNGLVYECELIDGLCKPLKLRSDKSYPLSSAQVKIVMNAPSIQYYKSLLTGCEHGITHDFRDVCSLAYKLSLVKEELLKQPNTIRVSQHMIIRIMQRNNLMITKKEIVSIIESMCKDYTSFYGFVDSGKLDEIKVMKPIKLSYCKIVKMISKSNICCTPYEMAVHLTTLTPRIVSLKKILLMMVRNQISNLGIRITHHLCRGKQYVVSTYEEIIEEHEIRMDDVIEHVCAYAKNNYSKNSVNVNLSDFKKECSELIDTKLNDEQLCEIGDVMMLLVKTTLEMYSKNDVVVNADSYIWRILSKTPLLESWFAKMNKRIREYGCIRNHLTCGAHVCSTGFRFDPGDMSFGGKG